MRQNEIATAKDVGKTDLGSIEGRKQEYARLKARSAELTKEIWMAKTQEELQSKMDEAEYISMDMQHIDWLEEQDYFDEHFDDLDHELETVGSPSF